MAKATFHRWRNQYGGSDAGDGRLLDERENARLSKLAAEQALGQAILKEAWRARP